MSKRIVEGLWDCPHCKSKGIGGLTKHCPRCGHPQDPGTVFYMGTEKKYLEADLAAQYGQGADWLCPFCGSLNRVRFEYCANCAAPKGASEKDYFGIRADAAQAQPGAANAAKAKWPDRRRKRWLIVSAALLLVAAALYMFWPRTYDATVSTAAWSRKIDIEAHRTVQESGWSVPDGGRVYDQKRELSHYEQVLDHYESRTRQVPEQVYDGEDQHTSYVNNGDGTFTEERYSVPRYRTEWRTETYREPVYRNEAVYATKYYYDIDRWVVDRTESSEGADSAPYWPQYALADNERTGFQGEAYVLRIKTQRDAYSVSVPLAIWEKYHAGDPVKISVIQGDVASINDESIP